MALFRRSDPASTTERPPRASVASEAQAAQLRGRARRRLVGAVALVLAVVIVLPMALDSEPLPVASDIAIVIPERASAFEPQFAADQDGGAAATPPSNPAATNAATASPSANATTTNAAASRPATPPAATTTTPASATPPAAPPATRPVPSAAPPRAAVTPPAPQPAQSPAARTDDGSRALALLEGRAVADSAARAESRNYVLQVATYSSESDANSRRDQLSKAGFGNVFVAAATVNGRTLYRLRVGPYPSRDAAQAAQPRLRTLGYDNGLVVAQ